MGWDGGTALWLLVGFPCGGGTGSGEHLLFLAVFLAAFTAFRAGVKLFPSLAGDESWWEAVFQSPVEILPSLCMVS